MSVTSNYNLFSNTTAQAMQAYMNNQTYTDALATVNTKNLANNNYYGFDYSRIFSSASSGVTGASIFSKGYETATERVYNTQKLMASSKNGASMMDCLYNSMNSIALGQDKPKSIFEQRLELMVGHDIQTSGTMLGDYSNYFSTSSSPASAATTASASAATSTATATAAQTAGKKTGETALSKYTGRAASAKSVSEMMGFLA